MLNGYIIILKAVYMPYLKFSYIVDSKLEVIRIHKYLINTTAKIAKCLCNWFISENNYAYSNLKNLC